MALTPLSEALELILATAVAQPEREVVALEAAANRFCAEAICADRAVPPADNSAMDGYAVASRDVPGVLSVSQRVPAGQAPAPLQEGTAARIFTGAEIPEGADSVVLQEEAQCWPRALSSPRRHRGSIFADEAMIFSQGTGWWQPGSA